MANHILARYSAEGRTCNPTCFQSAESRRILTNLRWVRYGKHVPFDVCCLSFPTASP